MNFLLFGIPLGRWFGITVVINWMFVIYAFTEFSGGGNHISYTALYLTLLFGTVLLHEFGHALSCKAVGGEATHIVLWPLGGLAFVQPPNRPWPSFVTTACGPLVNAVLWPVAYFTARYLIEHHFGPAAWRQVSNSQDTIWVDLTPLEQSCVLLWQINQLLLLFNLIPAYPMDGGRILQEIVWAVAGYGRSLQVAGMVGTVAGFAFIVLGTGLQSISIPQLGFTLGGQPNTMLMIIGALAMWQSFTIYQRSKEIKSWRKN